MDYAKMMNVLTSEGKDQDNALDALNREELEYLLKECRAALARRQAAKNGGLAVKLILEQGERADED